MKAVRFFTKLGIGAIVIMGFNLCSCKKYSYDYQLGNLEVKVTEGEHWKHDFPLFLGIKIKNTPQMAIWVEDLDGNYIATVFATKKIATEGWMANGGNRRKEALPHWCYKRGVQYSDGLYLPTKDQPLVDAITGATPDKSFQVKTTPKGNLRQFVLKFEVNHSTDFNSAYPKGASVGDSNYSGGEMGGGQPALVYAALVDLDSMTKEYKLTLVGHSSPDGSSGELYPDLSDLTTALSIVKEVAVVIH